MICHGQKMVGGKDMVMCVVCGQWKKAAIETTARNPTVDEMFKQMGIDPNTFQSKK